jgi:ribonuclease HII
VRVLGIDEAGRGCVLGPLVVAGFVHDGDEDVLRRAGAADSKTLSAARREAVRRQLEALGTGDARRVEVSAIDEDNLNRLEEAVVVDLIRTHRPDRVVLDALGHPRTLDALVTRLHTALAPHGLRPTIVVEPKADANHACCGAASIFAKTTRDRALDALRPTWGELGSGYPGDPKTKAWLVAHLATGRPWPDFVRTRWGTVRALVEAGRTPGEG